MEYILVVYFLVLIPGVDHGPIIASSYKGTPPMTQEVCEAAAKDLASQVLEDYKVLSAECVLVTKETKENEA